MTLHISVRKCQLWLILFVLLCAASTTQGAITFNGLAGSPGPFTNYSEGGFQLTASGQWWALVDTSPTPGVLGNPEPGIWAESYYSSLEITNNSNQLFTFSGFDIWNPSLATPSATYSIQGSLNGSSVFSSTGVIPGNQWYNAASTSSLAVDKIVINLERGQAEQVYLDNLDAQVIPEPSGVLVWLGLLMSTVSGVRKKWYA